MPPLVCGEETAGARTGTQVNGEETTGAAVMKTRTDAGPGLARIERPIWPFNPGQAPGVRLALISQTLGSVQPTKHPKTGSREPWPGWAANQTHPPQVQYSQPNTQKLAQVSHNQVGQPTKHTRRLLADSSRFCIYIYRSPSLPLFACIVSSFNKTYYYTATVRNIFSRKSSSGS